MPTWTALTTFMGKPDAERLGAALEELDETPTGVGVFDPPNCDRAGPLFRFLMQGRQRAMDPAFAVAPLPIQGRRSQNQGANQPTPKIFQNFLGQAYQFDQHEKPRMHRAECHKNSHR